jgi:hypothetical protein
LNDEIPAIAHFGFGNHASQGKDTVSYFERAEL